MLYSLRMTFVATRLTQYRRWPIIVLTLIYFSIHRMRFLSYAGAPLILAVPGLYFTLCTAQLLRGRRSLNSNDHFTPAPARISRKTHTFRPPTPRAVTVPTPSPSAVLWITRQPGRAEVIPALANRLSYFHLPFPPPSTYSKSSSSGQAGNFDESDSLVSSIFPQFVDPPQREQIDYGERETEVFTSRTFGTGEGQSPSLWPHVNTRASPFEARDRTISLSPLRFANPGARGAIAVSSELLPPETEQARV